MASERSALAAYGAQQRGAGDARRERGHPDRQRINRGRGAHGTAVRLFQIQGHRGRGDLQKSLICGGFRGAADHGLRDGARAARECRTPRRPRAAVGDDVSVGTWPEADCATK